MTITGVAPAHYDSNFACCGGCSSSKRADAYNGKLATGSLVFIWDIKLKTDPQPVCSITFPYDPALNEQVGERRVRSGRMVGTNYPIDNDYDYLCCEQRGTCRALNEDASGKCQCVNRWGFSGDHCQDSVYDVAAVVNDETFPNATNLSSVAHLLPDLRSYLISFDYDVAITSATTSSAASGFHSILETGSYRQFGWSTMAYFALAAAFFALIFVGHVMWQFCCFKCGCRRRNPLAKPKIYSRLQKIVWGSFMMLFLLISTGAALMTFFIVYNDIKPMSESVFTLLNETLPNNLTTFETNFLSPLDELLASGYHKADGMSVSLQSIQEHSRADLETHTFLDKQSYGDDILGKSIFDLLNPLSSYSLLFPTINNPSVDCDYMNITQPSVISRMTIGGETGCFKCKTCLALMDLVEEAKTSWRMHIFEVQIDMLTAKRDLKDFSTASSTLSPSIQRFLERMHTMCSEFRVANERLAVGYNVISGEIRQFSLYCLGALCGLCGLSIFLGASAFSHGVLTGKRKIAHTTSFFAEIGFLIAILLTGILYAMSTMIQDGIVVLGRLENNTYAFLPSTQSAEDVRRLLLDQNLVEATEMVEPLAFSDTLRVPPHPTPDTDYPSRFNFTELYDMPKIFALENIMKHSNEALIELFAWNETFVTSHFDKLKALALTDSNATTPYTDVIHKTILNSTVQQLMDPNGDGNLVTTNDLLDIQNIFNRSWRGVSDRGVELNTQIQTQWLMVAQLYYQKQKLEMYVATVSSIISKIHPLLDDLIVKTSAMEKAEFQLQAPVEFVTDSVRASKIADCSFNGNCAWLRSALNELLDLFQRMVQKTERAFICCAVSVVTLLLINCNVLAAAPVLPGAFALVPLGAPVNAHYHVTPQAPPDDRRGSFQGAIQPQQPYGAQAPLYPDIGQNAPPSAPARDSFIQQNYSQNYSQQTQNYTQQPQNYGPPQQSSQNFRPPPAPTQQLPAPFLRDPTLHGGYGPVQPGSFSSSTSSMAMMPDGMAPTPSSVVELRFRCKSLKKSDFLSQSDPFIVVYMQEAQKKGWREVGRTETIMNTPDPAFAKSFQVDFFFEEVQRLRVEVFDRDSSSERLSDHDFLGCVEITMGQLMSSKGQSAVLKLLQNDKGRGHVHHLSGHVVIDAEEVATCADMINVRFTATKLDNKDGWFGASDPFLNVYRLRDNKCDPLVTSSWILVWRSEVVMNNCDPKWRRATLSVQKLCNGDLSKLLKFECMDWEKNGKHQFIGSCTVKAAEFVTGERRSMDLINRERQAKKGKRYKNSGVLILEQIDMFKQHTFAEYLRGGCEVSLVVGIDYTASNGSPSDPGSLHYMGGNYQGQMNDYQAAITATGAILEPYDSDKRFPVYGFGGLVNGVVNHCFPLTFDPSQPEVEGIGGIMNAYSNSFQFVQLHGPTKFAPLVHQAAAIARTFSTPVEQSGSGNLKYFVLLIITDGAIMDMQETIDELVQASTLPLSIVIVAVGNADFTAMNALDADDKLLVDSRRQKAARDIVQFVPFNQFRRNPARLAKETLAEIPTQLLQYYNMKGIQPRTPLQRQGTSYLVNSSISSGIADALDVEV